MPHLILIGFMGTGKSTVGKILARRLGRPFLDTDLTVRRRAGRTIPEIFRAAGEGEFRALEKKALLEAVRSPEAVIATGGGAPLDPENLRLLKETGRIVCLTASPEAINRRVGDTAGRPLLGPVTGQERLRRISHLLEQRRPFYASAHLTIDTTSLSPQQTAARIEQAWLEWNSKVVTVRVPPQPYRVVVGRGILAMAGKWFQEVGLSGVEPKASTPKVGVVTHPSLRSYADVLVRSLSSAGFTSQIIYVPEGERSKNAARLGKIHDTLIRLRFERGSVVAALGGGVIGDLAGFAAATLYRGVPLVQVPTTLVAQVDASIGGKTGINHPGGKNLIGSFHQPRLVLSDTATLDTLPPRQYLAGLAEVVKYGVIADEPFFTFLEQHLDDLLARKPEIVNQIVFRSSQVKGAVVEEDERESHRRRILNLGHTLGHALENASRYRMLHGEAVSIGMVFAARLAQQLGICDEKTVVRQRELLERLGLPTRLPRLSLAAVQRAIAVDKKVRGGVAQWVLPEKIGRVRLEGVPWKAVADLLSKK